MSKLFIVPTPIGNLADITFRAIEVLKSVDIILAEDTRTSGKLLKAYDITTRMRAFHAFNEHQQVQHIVAEIAAGKTMALITDAGTPAISDPGFLLTRTCISAGVAIETLPGATAFVPALVNSGLPVQEFTYIGFLPVKKGRATRLQQLVHEPRTIVLYESPHRIIKTLQQLHLHLGDRLCSVSREISKKFEETKRGTLSELIVWFQEHPPKGEFVMVVAAADYKHGQDDKDIEA